ncbi:MAG: hypothetical protein J6U04_05350 [Salinivirgaceae bacterium]|nr:hypothetical protein [Salinivirgaceae bacterium]
MTETELKNQNPWLQYPYVARLYDEKTNMIHPIDSKIVDDYNNNRPLDCRFELHTPPGPFQGNPFRSKVIFLSLNPGFVEHNNKDAALLLEQVKDLRSQLYEEWHNHMIHNVTSFFPDKGNINVYQGFQLLGEWYWYKKLARLLEDSKIVETDFYSKIALIQLMPYASVRCNKVITNLETQRYTKKLINYLLESPDGPLFVVMRSEPDWGKLLGIDFQREYKNRFILRKRDINERRPRAQSINPNAFTDDGYRRILNAINPELNK